MLSSQGKDLQAVQALGVWESSIDTSLNAVEVVTWPVVAGVQRASGVASTPAGCCKVGGHAVASISGGVDPPPETHIKHAHGGEDCLIG